ncbi:MAG: 5'-nucleotidase C-terminal domain-containing protein [Runella sp.]
MSLKKNYVILLLLLFLGSSCTRYFIGQPLQMKPVVVSDTTTAPTTVLSQQISSYLRPYQDSLQAQMNTVLANSPKRIGKGRPESELGNLFTDLLLQQGQQRYGKPIHVMLTNNGGLRTDLPAGNITLGQVYELMPFDNALVVLTLSGPTMQKAMLYIAQRQEPQSGLRLRFNKMTNQLTEALVNGQPFDANRTYTLLTSDYMATSTDFATIAKEAQQYEILNYLMRDALADGLRQQGQSNQPLNPRLDGRIIIE